jgi:hypothetical protein
MSSPARALAPLSAVALLSLALTGHAAAQVTDFNSWTLLQDPPHPNFTAQVNSGSTVTLNATAGPIPNATDIGYASVNGPTVASSTAGHAFDPAQSFSLSVDYNLTFGPGATGGLAIGFGVGEDTDGANSAGAVLLTNNGSAFATSGAARINNVNFETPKGLALGGPLAGTMTLAYAADTGSITATVGNTSATFAAIQDQWSGTSLLPSFFLRSAAQSPLVSAWSAGTAAATFSNFTVLSGTATVVPEPTAALLMLVATLGLASRRTRLM